MKIRTRLTLLFTFITATILLGFAITIYFSARNNREKEFYIQLRKEAITKANLFLEAKVDSKTLQDIYKNNRAILSEVEVAIYSSNQKLLYHDAVDIDFVKETPRMLQEILQKAEIQFYQQDWQVVGIRYTFQNQNYIITAAAYDQHGYNELNSLLKNSLMFFLLSLTVIYFSGRFFSQKALEPIKQMVDRAQKISAINLDLRLPLPHTKDELAELANTFNQMLDRLQNAYEEQKRFILHISHELRTPLTALTAELELSLQNNHNMQEYKAAIQNVLKDTQKLVRLINSLLDLAKASSEPSQISFKPVRIDELLLDARQQVLQANPEYKVTIYFQTPFENEEQISVWGNEYLLKIAFINLIENGCKFSTPSECVVSVALYPSKIILSFSDKGIGIAKEDLKNIFTPFYRGKNKHFAQGHGIGLTLTHKIILLHHGTLNVISQPSFGTTFTAEIPNLTVSNFAVTLTNVTPLPR
ncbi:MAG: HAMP domain-containing sensor histidine kinase [Bacteroidia bacterium]|nr:HAMP domain-containing histidine kinase [Bacteroidia bacterium]MDW8157994.1 HAMP domain-containing sensor histidine kinase [Bacteroidia bacterium]